MKKTLLVTLEYPPQVGGVASYVWNMVNHLPPEAIVVYAPKLPGADTFDNKLKSVIYRRNPYWFFLWPHWLRMTWQIWKIVKKENIDDVMIHNILPVGEVMLLLKKLGVVKTFSVFLHGTDIQKALHRKFKWKLFAAIYAQASRVYVNSDFLKRKLSSKLPDISKVTVLYPCPGDHFFNTVSVESVQTLKSHLALQGKKVLITVARMVEGKGYPHMVRLLPQLVKQIPNLVWLIVGDGPKKQEIIKQIQGSTLQNVVRFLGVIPTEDLPAYYQAADVFVLLTHPDEGTEEGWGTVFLEAAASGLPVLAGRAGGVEEAVEHGQTGLVVDIYQEKLVSDTIVELLNNSSFAKELGAKGKQRASVEFRWSNQLKKLNI